MIKWYFDQKLSRLGKRALYWKSSNKWSTSFYPFPDMVLRNFDIRGTAVHLCSKSRARSYWKASTNWRKYRTNLGFRLYWKTDEKTGSRSWNWKFFIKGCCCPRGTRTNWLAPWKSRFLAGKKNVYHWKSHFEPFDDFQVKGKEVLVSNQSDITP